MHRTGADPPRERRIRSAPSLRCSRRENILGPAWAGFRSGAGKLKPAPTRSNEPLVATRLLRHVGRIEATPHSSNQVNTGMTMQVNTGARAIPRASFAFDRFIAKPPSIASSSSATAASKPRPALQYPLVLVSRPNPPRPPGALCDPLSPSLCQSPPPPASTYLSEPSCPPQKSQPSYTPSPDAAKRSRTEIVRAAYSLSGL